MESTIDAEQKLYQQELTEHNMLQDALSGNNLLGMMIEDKPKFGRQTESTIFGTPEAAPSQAGMKGADAIDLFIDPMAVFGSERHPALQEVLKQIEKSKTNRGEAQKELKLKRCKA